MKFWKVLGSKPMAQGDIAYKLSSILGLLSER